MEEDEYKSTYNELATVRCVFEKTLTSHLANQQVKCHLAEHFCLADREGYSCNNALLSSKCSEVLKKLRENSTFVLKLHEISGPLPHNMEIRVQAGGMLGLSKLLSKPEEVKSEIEEISAIQPAIPDISQIISQAEKKYGEIDNLPFNEIVQAIVQFQGRRRRQRESK